MHVTGSEIRNIYETYNCHTVCRLLKVCKNKNKIPLHIKPKLPVVCIYTHVICQIETLLSSGKAVVLASVLTIPKQYNTSEIILILHLTDMPNTYKIVVNDIVIYS